MTAEVYTTLTIFTDGGSRGNPGAAAWGFVAQAGESSAVDDSSSPVLGESAAAMGTATNNEALPSPIPLPSKK
jgi:ribonuclease HI